MRRVSDKRLAEWFNQVADGLAAGMNAVNAVAMACSLPKDGNRALCDAFEAGMNWAQAFEAAELSLSPSERAILAAAEQSGTLPQAMQDLARGREESAATKLRILLALLYPVLLIHLASLVFAVRQLVDGSMAKFAVAVAMVLVPVWSVALFGMAAYRYCPGFLKSTGRFVPLFSAYLKASAFAALSKTLAGSLKAGMAVEHAWEAATHAAGHPRTDQLGQSVLRSVRQGSPASRGLEEKGTPSVLYRFYRSGEETGALVENLERAGEKYGKEATGRLRAASLVYPGLILMLVFAFVVYQILQFYLGYFERIQELGS